MNQLAESLIYNQPLDPRSHVIEVLQQLIEARDAKAPAQVVLTSQLTP